MEPERVARLAVIETKLEEYERARRLQAEEYERRLQELNHAHQRQNDTNAKYVTREVWESSHRESAGRFEAHISSLDIRFSNQFSTLDARMDEFDRWRAKIVGIALGVGALSGVIGGIVTGLILRLLKA